jgi:hypothetical protein
LNEKKGQGNSNLANLHEKTSLYRDRAGIVREPLLHYVPRRVI